MKKLRLLLTMIIVLAAVGVQAQVVNTGVKPFAGSTHEYEVKKSTLTTDLVWTVEKGGVAALDEEFDFVGAFDAEIVNVKWLEEGTYILKLTETRTDLAAVTGCPTVREMQVIVSANNFEVFAEIVGDDTACATVVDPVVDADVLGDNSTDVFGTTTRVYKVKVANNDESKKWKFNYALTDIATDEKITGVNVKVTGNESISGNTVTMAAGANQIATITLTYNTNKNTAGARGQDSDFSLILTIDKGYDELGTPDSDETAASNIKTYFVKAVPATTGITTN